MEFDFDKCAKATFVKGKLQRSENINLENSEQLKHKKQDVDKYLRTDEHDGIQQASMHKKLTNEHYRRIRAVLKTELNAKNKISAIGYLVLSLVHYSFGIIK